MLYSTKNVKGFKKLIQLVSLNNLVVELRLQDKLGERNLHKILKTLFEPLMIQSKTPLEI